MDNFTDPQIGGHKAELGLELLGKFWSVPHHCSVEGCPGRENKRKLELFDEMLAALEESTDMLNEIHASGETPHLNEVSRVSLNGAWAIARAKGEK